MTEQKIKVLYIGSLNRSGSTLVTKYFNEFRGFFSVNEVVFIGLHGLHNDFVLGSGERFSQNTVWQDIIKEAFGSAPDWRELSFFKNQLNKDLGLPTAYIRPKPEDTTRLTHYRENITKLYRAIAKVTKCSVIVDSSKSPDYAYLLSTVECIDMHLLHLTRDFRGVYFSHTKKIQRKDITADGTSQIYMRKSSLWRFIVTSYSVSLKLSSFRKKNAKYLRVKYEDFCLSPVAFSKLVLSFLRLEVDLPSIENQHQVRLKNDDLGIWGNPMRMDTEIKISQDQQWQDKLPTGKKLLLSFLLFPLNKLYGY